MSSSAVDGLFHGAVEVFTLEAQETRSLLCWEENNGVIFGMLSRTNQVSTSS